jgi:hypothetical protein
MVYGIDGPCINVHRSPNDVDHPARVYQNICRDSGICLHVHLFNADAAQPTDPTNIWYINNTCQGWTTGASLQAIEIETPAAPDDVFQTNANNRLRNNIFRGGGRIIAAGCAAGQYVDSKWNSDYNWYSDFNSNFSFGSVAGTFANWVSNTEGDDNSVNGTDPLFANEASNDFHLQAGSTAKAFCPDELDLDGDTSTVDLVDCGAYVLGTEQIGRELDGDPDSTPRRFRFKVGDAVAAAALLLFSCARAA